MNNDIDCRVQKVSQQSNLNLKSSTSKKSAQKKQQTPSHEFKTNSNQDNQIKFVQKQHLDHLKIQHSDKVLSSEKQMFSVSFGQTDKYQKSDSCIHNQKTQNIGYIQTNDCQQFNRFDQNEEINQNRFSFNPSNHESVVDDYKNRKTIINNKLKTQQSQRDLVECYQRKQSSITKVNEPIICCECKMLIDGEKNCQQISLKLTSSTIELVQWNDCKKIGPNKTILCISFENLIKAKLFPTQTNLKNQPIKKKQNIIKLTYQQQKNSMLKFVNRRGCKQLFLSFQNGIRYRRVPLPYFIFAKIIARKLKSNKIECATVWEPTNIPESLLLKRQINEETQKAIHKRLRKKIESKKSEKRDRSQTKKKNFNKTNKQTLNYLKLDAMKGFILKKSKHIKQWNERYTEIDQYGLHSYCDLKDWSPKQLVQKQRRPKQQTFTIFPTDNIQYLWTRFQTIQHSSFETKDSPNKQKRRKQSHKKMLIIKLKHQSWKSRQMLSLQTELGIPITNFCSPNPNNWLYHIFKMLS